MSHRIAHARTGGWRRLARLAVAVAFLASVGIAASHQHASASDTPDTCAVCHVGHAPAPVTSVVEAPRFGGPGFARPVAPAAMAPAGGAPLAAPSSRAPPLLPIR